jgi:ubiquinone/menaquinone biosynthesis C-methylase UbiE
MARRAQRRLDAALSADMRALPLARASIGGLLAFYSLIHVPRAELGPVLAEFRRVLRGGGRVLVSAHEGQGELHRDTFLDAAAPFTATFFELDELVGASQDVGLDVTAALRRDPYPSEGDTVRLYVEAVNPG